MTEHQVPTEVSEGSLAVYGELVKLWRLVDALDSTDEQERDCIRAARDAVLSSADELLRMRNVLGLGEIPEGAPRIELPRWSEAQWVQDRERQIAKVLAERNDNEQAILRAFLSFEDRNNGFAWAELVSLSDEADLDSSEAQAAVLRLYTKRWVVLGSLVPCDKVKDDEIFCPRLTAIPGPKGQSYTSARLTRVGRGVLDELVVTEEDDDGDGDD